MHTQSKLQRLLFEKILGKYSNQSVAIQELMEILSIAKDGIHNRKNGKILLKAAEIKSLAQHYNISIDELLIKVSNKTFFSHNLHQKTITSFRDYLLSVNHHVTYFSKLPKNKIYYASRDIPIFFYMMFPNLLSFKLYIYGLTTWYFDYLQDQKFNFDIVKHEEHQIAKKVCTLSCSFNSYHIWTHSIIEQTLNQIEYIAFDGKFEKKEIAITLCNEVLSVIQHCEAMAEAGRKFLPNGNFTDSYGEFHLFHNELASFNNSILAISNQQKLVFNTFDNPNFLFSNDKKLGDSTENWFKKLVKQSESLSVQSELHRKKYFNQLYKKIDRFQKRLETIFEFHL